VDGLWLVWAWAVIWVHGWVGDRFDMNPPVAWKVQTIWQISDFLEYPKWSGVLLRELRSENFCGGDVVPLV
jgi:hypothetical protein